ncbi:SRPBCC domain-containing protein [Saccharothrix xinjiangensis]|uniref:SRPBCC domain-containing protein n=1 Tax=Saccharothrix xinjiangensis TaxID=204798 RepID=A0ABV9XRN1_9PSEU
MGDTATPHVRTSASPERVRRALTDQAEPATWPAEHAEVELPDRWRFRGRHTPEGDEPRQVLEHLDDGSLRFTWPVGGERTTVGITWEARDDHTVVSVSQSHFPGWADTVA